MSKHRIFTFQIQLLFLFYVSSTYEVRNILRQPQTSMWFQTFHSEEEEKKKRTMRITKLIFHQSDETAIATHNNHYLF